MADNCGVDVNIWHVLEVRQEGVQVELPIRWEVTLEGFGQVGVSVQGARRQRKNASSNDKGLGEA